MAKDPAFLFYPNDWVGGTMILNRHQKGCYIDLLIAQFNNGPLSLETIKTVLGQDQAVWTVLSKKFREDSEGNFFNERLAAEIEKRKKYSQSRKDNIEKRYLKPTHERTYVGTHVPHMESRDEDGNEKRKYEFLTNQKWKEEFCMAKSIQLPALEKLQRDFISDTDLKGEHVDSYKRYFTNWYNKNQINGNNRTSKQNNSHQPVITGTATGAGSFNDN